MQFGAPPARAGQRVPLACTRTWLAALTACSDAAKGANRAPPSVCEFEPLARLVLSFMVPNWSAGKSPAGARRWRAWLALAALGVALTGTPSASAAAPEEQATQLADSAIFEDYLNLRFGPAEVKLKKALELCETRCRKPLRARVLRDLGIVYVAGKGGRDNAIAAFLEALSLDPKLRLDPDLSSEDAKSAFAEAKALAANESPSEPEPEAEPGEEQAPQEPSTEPTAPTGTPPEPAAVEEDTSPPEIKHSAPKSQAVNVPLPLYLEIEHVKPAQIGKVTVRYRPFGVKEYATLPLHRHDAGWAVELSCAQIGSYTGNLSYYVVVTDAAGKELVVAGSEAKPFTTAIKQKIQGDAPHLPGRKPPAVCTHSNDDCPPDFPGCAAEPQPVPETEATPKEPSTPIGNGVWLTLSFQGDFLLLPKSDAACSENDDYGCYYQGGVFRDPAVAAGVTGADGSVQGAGTVNGGFALGTKRILLGADVAITPEIVAGVKVGFAFGGGPQQKTATLETAPFMPFHAEVRGSYWFNEGISRGTFRPFAAIATGIAQVDASVSVRIVDLSYRDQCRAQGQDATCVLPTLEAWNKTGTAFASLGGGLLYAITPDSGVLAEVRYMYMFPAPGSVVALQLGYSYGLPVSLF